MSIEPNPITYDDIAKAMQSLMERNEKGKYTAPYHILLSNHNPKVQEYIDAGFVVHFYSEL